MPEFILPEVGDPLWNLNPAIEAINQEMEEGRLSDAALAARFGTAVPVSKFGAKGDGTTDDTDALNEAITSGLPLYWGGPDKVYVVSASLTTTLTQDLVWRSDGATIKVDSEATHIHRVVFVTSPGYNVYIDGPLTIDANSKANIAWYFNNATTTFAKFTGKGMGARNIYRADTSMTGGDGIWVRGAWRTVYLEQPDIRNIVMAEDAGVQGSQGVCGITVSSAGAGMAPDEVNIIAPYVENVWCEDDEYLVDQDGIRVFTEEDNGSVILFPTHFNIRGGKIKNCGGRAIKAQTEFGRVEGVFISRRGTPWASRTGSMPEIDFQTGAGIIRDIEVQYVSNTPSLVIKWTGTQQEGGKYSTGILVSGVKVSYSGSQLLPQFMSARLLEQRRATVTVENVEIINFANRLQGNFLSIQGQYTDTQSLIVRMSNITAPMLDTSAFLRRVGAAVTTNVSMHNIASTGDTAAFSSLANSGNYTEVTSGNNIRVS